MDAILSKDRTWHRGIRVETTKLNSGQLYVVSIIHIIARSVVLLLGVDEPASQSSRLDPSQDNPASPRVLSAEKLAF